MHIQTVTSANIAYRINDAAKAVGLSRSTLYELAKQGKLPIRKVHGRSLILREDLEALVRSDNP